MPRRPEISKKDKAKAMQDAINWLREHDPDLGEVDDLAFAALAKVSGISMPDKLTPDGKEKFVAESIYWLRNNNPWKLGEVNDATLNDFASLAGVPLLDRTMSREERTAKGVDKFVDWLRQNDPKVEEVDDVAFKAFAKLAGIPLPQKFHRRRKRNFLTTQCLGCVIMTQQIQKSLTILVWILC